MLTHPLLPKLRALKLSGMAETFEQRAQTALEESMSPLEFFALLLDDELERREQNRLSKRIKESKIDERKTLNRFDFSAVPQVPKTLMADLALCPICRAGRRILFFVGRRVQGNRISRNPWLMKRSNMAIKFCINQRIRFLLHCMRDGPMANITVSSSV